MKLYLQSFGVYFFTATIIILLIGGQFFLKYWPDIQTYKSDPLMIEFIWLTASTNVVLGFTIAIPFAVSHFFKKSTKKVKPAVISQKLFIFLLFPTIMSLGFAILSSDFIVKNKTDQMVLLYNMKSKTDKSKFVTKDLFTDVIRLKSYDELFLLEDTLEYETSRYLAEFTRVVNTYVEEDSILSTINSYDFNSIGIDPFVIVKGGYENESEDYYRDEVIDYLDELYYELVLFYKDNLEVGIQINKVQLTIVHTFFLFIIGALIGVLFSGKTYFWITNIILYSLIPVWYKIVSYLELQVSYGLISILTSNILLISILSTVIFIGVIAAKRKDKITFHEKTSPTH